MALVRNKLEALLVSEIEFARAYGALTAMQRAWLKKTIARLYVWYDSNRATRAITRRDWQQGFSSLQHERPVDTVVVIAGREMISPVRLLAAVLPPIVAGVQELFVFIPKDGTADRASLLTALELAGCESVAWFDPRADGEVLDECCRGAGSYRVVFIGRDDDLRYEKLLPRFAGKELLRVESGPLRSGIWWNQDAPIDLGVFHWAQPDISVELWNGEEKQLPAAWIARKGSWESFTASSFDVVYVPDDRVDDAVAHFPLVLGNGHEGCWLWPALSKEAFYSVAAAWFGEESRAGR